METAWEIIAPWVTGIGGSAIIGLITFIIRLGIGKIINRNTQTLRQTFNVDSLSQLVAEKFAGRTLNIDATALTEKALRKLAKELDAKVATIESATQALTAILVAIGKNVSHFKNVPKSEIEELITAIQLLEQGYTPPEKEECMTVKLEPIATPTAKEDGSKSIAHNAKKTQFGGW